ncbi:hypothetical protein Pmani_035668 [Petrolisthes manimaculis]|uniref:AAA+ ATPase domain-containing protein n=1 Tax=Petrolisthes manimaculis TaxID=1843537 RepID=A0AAE1NL65_9EUCA|nr:hypothetical protein Pmani_035668 [Petrolisthes manimaculis]
MAPLEKRKRVNLSIGDKLELINKLEAGVSVARVCEIYGVKKQTVSDIRKAKDKLKEYAVKFDFDSAKDMKGVIHARSHMRKPQSETLEEAVFKCSNIQCYYEHLRTLRELVIREQYQRGTQSKLPVEIDVESPVCGASFPSSRIESHAKACIQARFGDGGDGSGGVQKSGGGTSPVLGKRKCSEPQSPQPQTDAPGTSKPTNPSPSNKKSRQEQVQAWSFLGKSSRGSIGPRQSSRDEERASEPERESGTPKTQAQMGMGRSNNTSCGVPLAERMRPTRLDTYVGQESILSTNSFLRTLLQKDSFTNLILWGPPGCGKTSLANIVSERCRGSERWRFVKMSACTSGVGDVKAVVKEANSSQQLRSRRTIIFLDEVHRFNKAQQDVFLPHVESGLITLIGATTENPSFTLNSALLSRCRVIVLEALQPAHIRKIMRRTLRQLKVRIEDSEAMNENGETGEHDEDESSSEEETEEEEETEGNEKTRQSNGTTQVSQSGKMSGEALRWVSEMSGGDARCALNTLQILLDTHTTGLITRDHAKEALQRSHVLYDRKGDEHYNFASALQKSIRGGDDNAALYWTMRMIQGGEDPRFIARRLLRTAAEDIGLGAPEALTMATSTMQAVQMLGMPESDVILAQCAVYLARCQHNPEVYLAMAQVKDMIQNSPGPLPPVPLHLRNASTKLMKDLGYGRGYSHNPQHIRNISYMPDTLKGVKFFKSKPK